MSIPPIRFAQFNASLNRSAEGQLITDLSTPGNTQAQVIAEIIQRTNPDVLLINEFDYDASGTAAELFRDNYLAVSQNGVDPVEYPYFYVAPSNTGIPSGFDLNNNGTVGGGDDAFGFGFFPGQFGMVVYSKYPIDFENVRTFQNFLWKDMPGALLPDDPTTPAPQDWYSPEELEVFRLSSKSHWDVPVEVNGETIHVLVSHPTPPVFDGPEDRNGTRNHDEIRFWADYVTPGAGGYIYDDNGGTGGLAPGAKFVIMGDQNADPFDGDSVDQAIQQLLNNPGINTAVTPTSAGGPDAAIRQGGANATHIGDPAFDTADFADGTPGNLRADYVLPSNNLQILDAAVFWPPEGDPLFPLAGNFPFPSSDHRLVWVDVVAPTRSTVTGVEVLGEVNFPTGLSFNGTEVGGLSGLVYDAAAGVYYGISDDRSQINPARFYTLTIDLSDSSLGNGDITFTDVTTLTDGSGVPFPALSLDPEGIALTGDGTLYISSEGDANRLINPFINEFSLTGEQLSALPIPDNFLPTANQSSGIRNNLAFESLTISPDRRYLYAALENALFQDGPAATVDNGSLVRILKYDLTTNELVGQFVYEVEPVPDAPNPPGSFSTNGLVELLAIDNSGTLLALERGFSNGVGNTVKLFEIRTQGALDVNGINDLFREEPLDDDGEIIPPAPFAIDPPVSKRELLDFADLGITPDNLEALSLGPVLPDGRQSLIVASDNNFSPIQTTQFIALALDTNNIPVVLPKLETTQILDTDEPVAPGVIPGDSDDPAIWVHPTDSSQSLVITSLKDGGLAVFDLNGQTLQTILPADYGDIRYNNVDLIYGFKLGGQTVDLAIASDRENDTLAIYAIDPATRQLTDVTSSGITESIFGIDDGEQTAYGLATYVSPISGKPYVFVSQREGDQIAQLELVDDGNGGVTTQTVRIFTVPIPTGGELEDAQVEGMVADRELGYLYIGQENVGIWKFDAEPAGSTEGLLIDSVEGDNLTADVEGLTIYYGPNGTGYLLASSQGDSTVVVYRREGDNSFIGNFAVGASGSIDSTEESDGADVINVPLGPNYPFGLLVVHDGANDPQNAVQDDEELENNSTNFKFVSWQDVANAFPEPLIVDTTTANPRNPVPSTLPNGVASGDTTADSTVLWTRSTVLGDVTFEYSTDPNFGTIAGTLTATVTDPLQPVKVTVTGLDDNTTYYYRVTDVAGVKLGGQFTTSNDLGDFDGLRFGVSGDWRGELSPYPAISNASDRSLEFFVEHGDTIYADYESPVLPGVEQVTTLEEYRLKHSEVYGTRYGQNTWADLRSSTSVLATIDDHEVINDFAGGAPASSDPRFPETTGLINDTQLFDNGLQAFQEYNPIRDEFYGATGDPRTEGERELYRNNVYGHDAATFLLDTRSFRDESLPNPDITSLAIDLATGVDQVTAYRNFFFKEVLPFDIAAFDPNRTLLGDAQLNDLKQDLLEAELNGVTWKFVMVPEPMQTLGPLLGPADRFDGYLAERTELLQFIESNDISNVVFIAADIHGTVVNNVTYQTAPGGTQIATSVFEITTGSVAFDAPFGQSVVATAAAGGFLSPSEFALYQSLPIFGEPGAAFTKDDFFTQLFNNAALQPFGLDPLGLDNNLPGADGLINATLLQGRYVAAHTFGWTEFDIDPLTQKLTVTTYGIAPYSEADLLANPADIVNRTPVIVSQFEVLPSDLPNRQVGTESGELLVGSGGDDALLGLNGNDAIRGKFGEDRVFAGAGDDFVNGGKDDDILYGGDGNDYLDGGSGNDILRGEAGNDILVGYRGADIFVIALGDGVDTTRDFARGIDKIGLAEGLTFDDLSFSRTRGQTLVSAGDELLLRVNGTAALTSADFVAI